MSFTAQYPTRSSHGYAKHKDRRRKLVRLTGRGRLIAQKLANIVEGKA